METIIKIKEHGFFTEENVGTAKKLINYEAYPHLYEVGEMPPSFEFLGTHEILAEAIDRGVIYGSSQQVRHDGLNSLIDVLRQDIVENGWRLYCQPISIRELSNGKYVMLDGRTKDKILTELKFKNRIVNIYRCNDEDALLFGLRCNMESPPAGLAKEADVVGAAHNLIQNKSLQHNFDAILEWIHKACGKGRFSNKKREEMAWQVFHHHTESDMDDEVNITDDGDSKLPVAWASAGEVNTWMKARNYIDNNKVMYLPVACSAPSKSIFAAAALSQQNPGKEIRVVIYTGNLTGYDLAKTYIQAILKFKNLWNLKLLQVSATYFNGKPIQSHSVKLYGCVPANIKNVCDDMSKLIIFGKTDDKIQEDYLLGNSLKQFLDLDTTVYEEEEEEETV